MRSDKNARAFRCGLAVVFLLALLPRVIYPVSRPLEWYERSVRFWDALLAGDPAGTYQRYHPGVTTMWVAGLGLRVYAVAHGWSGDDLLAPPQSAGDYRPYPVGAGVAALGVAIALGICLAYVLLVRLWGWPVGIVGGCLLALDPFHLEESKVLHIDAMLAILMLVSVLFLLTYLQRKRRVYLVLSGVFAGLALLTKSPAGTLFPWAALVLAYRHLINTEGVSEMSERRVWASRIGRIARDLGVWGFTAACVFVLLWPAMWVMPGEALSNMVQRVEFHMETVHRNPNFFAGQVIYDDPGPLFYLATLGWKTTAITLAAFLVTVLLLVRRVRHWRDSAPLWLVLAYACGFTTLMMFAARKEMRYLIPVFLALDVLAAWGLVQAASAIGRLARFRERVWVPTAIIVAALAFQSVDVLRLHPYYGTHHNLLLGGSRVAQYVLPLGDQGEGADLAARFLNGYPGAERRLAGVHRRLEELSERIFVGRSDGIELPEADYYVFTINSIQRQNRVEYWGEVWEACQEKEPLWTISFDGVPYVWVYPAYQTDPEAFAIDHRLDVQLGDHIRLLGYTASSDGVLAGDALTVALFWQSDGRVTEDYHVFVHLQDADGQMVAQDDGVPVQGTRPAWDWRDREVLGDEHALVIDTSLPGGVYTLSVGMYDRSTGVRLPATGPTGVRLPEDRIVLQEIQLISTSGDDSQD
jgi:hypothetical protein